ncbi:hypothetical protein Barb7_02301 [Bacteroidales bacterium Barb7]|nr:hypothetical protein Barb7_02301 [Bacteroidales bacterium Barb7]
MPPFGMEMKMFNFYATAKVSQFTISYFYRNTACIYAVTEMLYGRNY